MAPGWGSGWRVGLTGDSDFDEATGNCGWKCGGGTWNFESVATAPLSLVPLFAFLGAATIS